jgi:hypothetical protein
MLRQCRLLGLAISSKLPVPGPAAAEAAVCVRQRQATRPLGSRVESLRDVLPALPKRTAHAVPAGPCSVDVGGHNAQCIGGGEILTQWGPGWTAREMCFLPCLQVQHKQ